MPPIYERGFVFALVGAAIIVAAAGVSVARMTGDGLWLNRAGALIVCVEGLLVLVELSRRMRLRHAEELNANNPYVRLEAIRAERQLVVIGVMVAIFGELLHGFGDLLFLILW